MDEFCFISGVFACFPSQTFSKVNSVIFPLLVPKIDSGTASKTSPLQ
jgi:hypothetical protein